MTKAVPGRQIHRENTARDFIYQRREKRAGRALSDEGSVRALARQKIRRRREKVLVTDTASEPFSRLRRKHKQQAALTGLTTGDSRRASSRQQQEV